MDSIRIPWNWVTDLPDSHSYRVFIVNAVRTLHISPRRRQMSVSNWTNKARNTYCSVDISYSCLPRHALGECLQHPIYNFLDSVRYESTNIISVTVYTWKIILVKHTQKKTTKKNNNNNFFLKSYNIIPSQWTISHWSLYNIKLFVFYLQVWDDELALVALAYARQCPTGHDDMRERAIFST